MIIFSRNMYKTLAAKLLAEGKTEKEVIEIFERGNMNIFASNLQFKPRTDRPKNACTAPSGEYWDVYDGDDNVAWFGVFDYEGHKHTDIETYPEFRGKGYFKQIYDYYIANFWDGKTLYAFVSNSNPASNWAHKKYGCKMIKEDNNKFLYVVKEGSDSIKSKIKQMILEGKSDKEIIKIMSEKNITFKVKDNTIYFSNGIVGDEKLFDEYRDIIASMLKTKYKRLVIQMEKERSKKHAELEFDTEQKTLKTGNEFNANKWTDAYTSYIDYYLEQGATVNLYEKVELYAKDERIGEKVGFQFPPRVDVSPHIYNKSRGYKRRKERGQVQETRYRYSVTKD